MWLINYDDGTVLISPKSKYKRLHLNPGTGPIVTNKLPY